MRKLFRNDNELIKAIHSGGEDRAKAIEHIFIESGFKIRISNYIMHRGGSVEDVEDIMIESFLIFDKNIRHHKFKKECSLATYLFSIAKFYWAAKRREEKKIFYTSDKEDLDSIDVQNPELLFINDEVKEELERLLKLLGEKCQQVLKYWSLSFSYKEIAKKMDLKNLANARKQKHNCQKKLAEHLRENPNLIPTLYYE